MATFSLSTGSAKDFPTIQGKLESFATNVGDDEDARRMYRLAQSIKRIIHEQWDDAPRSSFQTTVTVTGTQVSIVIDKT